MLALTLAILRLSPLYRKYAYLQAEVKLDWAEDRRSVTLSYLHSGITCYEVKGEPYKEEDRLLMRLSIIPVPEHTEEQVAVLKCKSVITDFYNLLGVITRIVFQNGPELTDTPTVVSRMF